jgi:cytoskeletal protein CcmA (bactofilin family)
VCADELLELQPKARVTGNVSYKALEMHHGAIITGTLAHVDDESRPGLKLASSLG